MSKHLLATQLAALVGASPAAIEDLASRAVNSRKGRTGRKRSGGLMQLYGRKRICTDQLRRTSKAQRIARLKNRGRR